MPLELQYKRHVCALLMMFVPYGLALPTLGGALLVKPQPEDYVVKLAPFHEQAAPPALQAGGTIVLPQVFEVFDPSRRIS